MADTHSGVEVPGQGVYRGSLESAPDAIVVVDSTGVIRLVNRQTEIMFGYGRSELLGKPVEILMPLGIQMKHPALRDGFVADPAPRPMGAGLELSARRKDGTDFPVDIQLSPIETEEGLFVSAAVRDATQRKLAESKFQGLLESAPDAIVLVDSEGLIRSVNSQTETLFGYKRDELVGNPVERLVPERIVAGVADMLEGNEAEPRTSEIRAGLELTARRKDGSEIAVDVQLSPLETEAGTFVSAAVRDVTDRVAAEADRASLAAIVNSSEDAIIGQTVDGTITTWNPGAELLYGFAPEEAVGFNIDALLKPADRAAERNTLLFVAQGENVGPYRGRRTRKDGTMVDVSIRIAPTRDAKGEIMGVACIHRDISERRRSEAIQGLLDNSLDAIVVLDSKGNIRLANRRTEALFGYDRAEVLGGSIGSLVPGAGATGTEALERFFANLSMQSPITAFELTARDKDGKEFPIEISLSPFETQEETLVSAAMRDTSERKAQQLEREQMEGRLRRSERLESLGQLAGGIAHDFNNLLAAVVNYAGLIQTGLKDVAESKEQAKLLEQIDDDAQQIRRATERAADLTRRLLAFSKRGVIKPKAVDLNEIIGEMEALLRSTIGEQIRLVTNFASDLWTVMVDPSQVEQIVLNLVINARDAMGEQGTLDISTANLSIGEADIISHASPGDHVLLTIADSGAGMDAQLLSHVFEPFFTTKPTGVGTGLGLASVYGSVTQAGGWVNIQSGVDLGTTVKVYLPRIAGKAEPLAVVVSSERRLGNGEGILLVEDEDFVRHSTMRMLTRAGYRVTPAQRPSEALDLLAKGTDVALILTDIVMPEMTGEELATRVREINPSIRIVYMSAYTYEVLTHRGIVEPGVTLLEKPFTEESLLRVIRDVLEGAE